MVGIVRPRAGPIAVAIEVVDVDVHAAPAAGAPVPGPDVDVAAVPVAAAAPREAADGEPDAEGEHAGRDDRTGRIRVHAGVVVGRRRDEGRPVHDRRVVLRNVDHLRIRGHDLDDLLLLHDRLLRRRLEGARLVGALAHALHGRHHLGLLAEERVAEILRPVEVLGHPAQQVGKVSEPGHARIPGLLRESVFQGLALQARIRLAPAIGLNQLERIGCGDQHLRDERIRVERDRRDQRVEIGPGQHPARRRARGVLGDRLKRLHRDQEGCDTGEQSPGHRDSLLRHGHPLS